MRAWRDTLLGMLWRAAERGELELAGEAAFLDHGAAFGDWIEQLG